MHVQRFYNCHGNGTLADMECAWMAAAEAAGFRLHNLNEGGANVDVRLRPGHVVYVMAFTDCTKMRVRGESDPNHDKRIKGRDMYTQGTDAYTQGTDAYSEGTDAFSQGTDAFSQGTDKYTRGVDKISRGVDKKTLGTDKVSGLGKRSLRGNGQDKYTLGTHKKTYKKRFIRSTVQWLAAWTLAQSQPGPAFFTRTEIDGHRMPQSQRAKVRLLEAQARQGRAPVPLNVPWATTPTCWNAGQGCQHTYA